jgi:hypothetical protein
VDFKKICTLYVNTSPQSSLRRKLYPQLIQSFKTLQLKRQKLTVGAMGFIHQPVYLGKLLVGSRFTLDYKTQTSLKSDAKAIESTMGSLSLKRDAQSLVLLLLCLVGISFYLSSLLDLYIETFIRANLDVTLREPLLTNVLSLGLVNSPTSLKFSIPMVVKLALQLNTFF